jgi:zinc transport system substrate-binding protein
MPAPARVFVRALVLAAGLHAAARAADTPHIAVSIAPLHSLAAAVAAGAGQPVLLVPASASPHGYALRPSAAAALREARLVLWVGPQLESFLVAPLRSLAGGARVVSALDAVGRERLLKARKGGAWAGGHSHGGAASPWDAHVWLDPELAGLIAAALVRELTAVDPPRAALYAENGGRLRAELAALDRELEAQLAPIKRAPFVVLHDAYQYLERRYGLAALGAVAVDPHLPPGAARLRELAASIAATDARCVFNEPQFPSRLAETLAAGGRRQAVLDPLGVGLKPGPALYFDMMRGLGRSFRDCLGT